MASTTFIDNQTIIYASWLNDVNAYTYNGTSISGILNGSTLALQTGGLNALNIDASQNVSIPKLSITNATVSGVLTIPSTAKISSVIYESPQTLSNNYTITTGSSAMSTGPITVASGKSVTIPSGSRWVIL